MQQSGKHKSKNTFASAIGAKSVGYSAAFLLFVGVVAIGYQSPSTERMQVNQTSPTSGLNGADDPSIGAEPSVDEIIATDVAANLTEQTNLPIATNLANSAVSLSAKSELSQVNDAVTAKPQIVQSTDSMRTIQTYTAKKGDTVQKVSAEFGISAETIKWANDLSSDAIEANRKITILPVDGVLHTVKGGETVEEIAKKYRSSVTLITSYNNLELTTPSNGQKLVIPEGVLARTDRPGYEAPLDPTDITGAQNSPNGSQSFSGDNGGRINSSLAGASAGNRYAAGNCTWYAYERRAQLGMPVGSFWGNANTWGFNAQAAGYKVDNVPAAGAILVDTVGYYGHVAVVESVKPNGDVYITEMNNYAYGGFNIVNDRTISAGQARAYQYIH